ncbi:Protein of unknown function [Tenacibaculum sp. MAR_2009_124]|uniref:DUF2938 family protein n=1 Tax=Tenacibaculum sp. MAR_2009_124 TaxID=1250059 RepID=UPI00089C3AA3|nr:DUF2938 family protein [Tenacibaculum sp. MAR_2009_124]SEB81547.1 Protein of unknown function [Tenacibaculum sp. MAR_2009_124]
MKTILHVILVGIGGTLTMDIYSLILKMFQVKTLDYRFVGRWIGHFPKGKFFHKKIMDSSIIPYEQIMGWVAHYFIGISFSFLLFFIFGKKWFQAPTFSTAIIIGIVTIIAPFFILQPAFGFGIAGSNLPNPNKARMMSLIIHCVYGIGLYFSAIIISNSLKN